VLGVERSPPDAQLIAQLLVAVLPEVRDDVALLLRKVRVVRLATGQDRLPPGVAARVGAGRAPDRIADSLWSRIASSVSSDASSLPRFSSTE
jgi:hypothetical protein